MVVFAFESDAYRFIYLQATTSVADLSSFRCLVDHMSKRVADAIAALERRDSNFACSWVQVFEGESCCPFRNV